MASELAGFSLLPVLLEAPPIRKSNATNLACGGITLNSSSLADSRVLAISNWTHLS